MGTIEFRRVEREPECLQSGEWMKTGMRWGENGSKVRHGKEYGFFFSFKQAHQWIWFLTSKLCLV